MFFITPAEWVRHIQNTHTESELALSNNSVPKRVNRVPRPHGEAPPSDRHCSICKKSFPSYASMLIHKRTHTGKSFIHTHPHTRHHPNSINQHHSATHSHTNTHYTVTKQHAITNKTLSILILKVNDHSIAASAAKASMWNRICCAICEHCTINYWVRWRSTMTVWWETMWSRQSAADKIRPW